MAGAKLSEFDLERPPLGHVAVKEAVFPFARFPGVDVLLGPEMRSTGEVMGLDSDFGRAFAKSQIASGNGVPLEGTVFISVKDHDKPTMIEIGRMLIDMEFDLLATRGTAKALDDAGLPVRVVNKVLEGRPHIVDAIMNGEVRLVINTTEGAQAIADSTSLRRAALLNHVPYCTTAAASRAMVLGIAALRGGTLEVMPLQAYSAFP